METTKMAKQAINFQKSAFEKTFNATVMLQDQTEKMANSFMDQASWMPAESKKLINDWVVAYKKGRDDFKKSVFSLKTLLVNLLECFKTIFDTTVVSGILGLALSINIQRGMRGTRMNHLTGKPPA